MNNSRKLISIKTLRYSTVTWIALYRLVFLAVIVLSFTYRNNAYSQYLDPTSKTNINKIDPLFEENIKNYKNLEQEIEADSKSAVDGIKSRKGFNSLAGHEKAELEASNLSNIPHDELQGKGREIKAKETWIEDYFIDYSKPGHLRYKQDAEEITSATDKMMKNLLGMLKNIGVDCKTVKGDKRYEPQYFIELEKRDIKDAIYDQFLCEELRGEYNCSDTVTVKCSKTGLRYGEWQDREIALDGKMLYVNFIDWGWSVKWKRKRHGWHISGSQGSESSLSAQGINDSARLFISNNLGVLLEQIHPVIGFPPGGRGIGNITPLYSRWRVAWDQYVFKYKYRDTYQVCEVWSEDWTERCVLR